MTAVHELKRIFAMPITSSPLRPLSRFSAGAAIGTFIVALCFNAASADAAPLPSTAAGALDPTFNGGAPILETYGEGANNPVAVTGDAAGNLIVAGKRAYAANDGDLSYVARHRPDGALDTSFANGGSHIFGDATTDIEAIDALVAADGAIWLVGNVSAGATITVEYTMWMARLNGDGTPDATFGAKGERRLACPADVDCFYAGIAQQADGRIVVAGYTNDRITYTTGKGFVDRYLSDGTPDAGFGSNGRLALPAFDGFYPVQVAIDAGGNLLVVGTRRVSDKGNAVSLFRLHADGTPDATFGSGGMITVSLPDQFLLLSRPAVQRDGTIVLGGYSFPAGGTQADYSGRVFRFAADGAADPSFGAQGMVTLAAYGFATGVQSDGRIVHGGHTWDQKTLSYRATLTRLLPTGQIDASFGAAGVVHPYDAGSSVTRALWIAPDDRVVTANSARPLGSSAQKNYLLARIIGSEITTNVVEFYNGALNHYFVTADPNEAGAIDAGAAGPGWSRTGAAWKSGGPNRVCRFYGSPDIDPATQQRKGPNGHFYTISSDECALVKQDAGWKFESYDFSGWPKTADGTCPPGTTPVKRAYNNRFAVNDSNHRYATSDAIYSQMLAAGWSGEGAVFCSPQ